jgi:hypothetical protein
LAAQEQIDASPIAILAGLALIADMIAREPSLASLPLRRPLYES